MRLSVSNIAWELGDEEAVAALLSEYRIDRIDIAPGKYFPDPAAATQAQFDAVRALWAGRGCRIEGMQALLFGTAGFNLFADPDDAMLDRLAAVCRIGAGVGARALTFGSPRQRDRSGLTDAAALALAQRFFHRLGDVAAAAGVILCLEPNPVGYGCNFMTTTAEAAAVVRAVDHPAIRLQLDIGAIAMNNEPVAETIAAVAPLIGHVHASEPLLATLGDGNAPHAEAAVALRQACPELTVTIEMAPDKRRPALQAVRQALDVASRTYGDPA